MNGFLKQSRDEEVDMLINRSHTAFILLTVIARRAARKPNPYLNLEIGEALLGDYEEYDMTEKQYRTAKINLEKWGKAAFKGTNKGTVARLLNTSIYDINISDKGEQEDIQRADEGRTRGEQGATNEEVKKERSKEVKKEEPSLLVSKKLKPTRYTSSDMSLAELLLILMKENNPSLKIPSSAALNKWADNIRLMREQDNRTDEDIEAHIRFSQFDNFWKANILSMGKLRKQYDALTLRMKERGFTPPPPPEPEPEYIYDTRNDG